MNNERCEKHGVTRCLACKIIEAKKGKNPLTVPTLIVIPPPTKAGVPPPSITNAAPPDIEMMDASTVQKEATELRKVQGAYDKEMEDLLAAKARQEAINASADVPPFNPAGFLKDDIEALAKGNPIEKTVSFKTLPVDDSHASQVMRAASAYADATRDYALKLASYAKLAEGLKIAADRLTEAVVERDLREKELKDLVAGGDK